MPALPADIAAASRPVTVATWSSAAIADRYPSARDGSITPAESFCDRLADAQVLVDQRAALTGTERRRFAVAVRSVEWPDPLAGFPTTLLIDAELRVAGPHLGCRIEVDLETEATSYELFG